MSYLFFLACYVAEEYLFDIGLILTFNVFLMNNIDSCICNQYWLTPVSSN